MTVQVWHVDLVGVWSCMFVHVHLVGRVSVCSYLSFGLVLVYIFHRQALMLLSS